MNSYKRLVPGFEAPVYVAWSRRNRSALVRVPLYHPGREQATRMELRCPDPACNPYLTFAALLQAGLEGIEKGYELPEPMEKNLYHLSGEERRRLGVEQLPESLGEAIEITAESELVLRTLGEHMFNRYVEIKRQEWDDYRVQVTQWELDRYLSILVGRARRARDRAGDRPRRREVPVQRLQQVPEGARVARRDLVEQRAAPRARGARIRARRVSWDRRSRPSAALEAPEGIGESSRSLRRAISASWSTAVEKKPPRSGSAKRAIISSASVARLRETSAPRRSLRTARAAPRAGTRGPRGRRRSWPAPPL